MRDTAKGKTSGRRILLISLMILLFGVRMAFALPSGETVIEGSATFDRSESNTLRINTASDKLIVDYNSFSIGANESVYFYQPSSSAMALNRVTGNDASNIFGSLTANGIIFLINNNGINIGSTANINAAGFIASTLNIANVDFLNNNFVFSKLANKIGRPVINNGYIRVRETGQIALLGSAVANAGTVETSLGSVVLVAGEKITLNLDTAGMISVIINDPVKEEIYGFGGEKLDSAVKNNGTIMNPGGKVILAAKVLNQVFDYAINNTGIVQAQSLVSHDGVVELVAEGAPILNAGTVEATQVQVVAKSAPVTNTGQIKANEVKVVSEAAPVVNAGKIEAAKVSISVTESDFTNTGQITATTVAPAVVDSGKLDISAINILQAGLISAAQTITLKATEKVESPYIETTTQTIASGEPISISPGLIIQAPHITLIAKQFGTTSAPLNIESNYIYLARTQGNIDIMQSLGIGTSVLVRGPPDGFGAIYYNKEANLELQATQVNLVSSQSFYFYGNITFHNFRDIVPDSNIYFEAGRTYTFKDSLSIIGAPDAGPEEFFIKLRSSEAGKYWYLDVEADNYTLERVNLSDAYALSKVVIPIGVDAGNNVNFEIDPTWDGGGTTNNWSDAVNWSGNTLPTSTTDATFNATSVKDSTVDAAFAGTIRDLLINAGYTGTITFSRSLSVRNFSQATGTVNLGSQTLSASNNFTISGGTFNADSGTVTIAAVFTLSAGTFNAGSASISVADNFTISGTGAFSEGTSTVTFTGAGATINILTSETFFNLAFAPTTAGAAKAVAANDTLIVTGTLTLTEGNINQGTIPASGTISAQGNITAASAFDGGSGRIIITGTANQTFTGSATATTGELPDITINKSSGTLTLAGTIRTNAQGAGAWTYTAGTIDAGTSTVVFDGAMTITGSHTLNNVTFNNAGARTISAGTTLTITGTLNYNDGTLNTGTIAAQGDIIQGSATDGGSAILQITGSANQTFTGNATVSAGELPDFTINKSAGTLTLVGTIRVNGAGAGAWTYIAGTVDATTNDSTVIFNGANTIDGQGTSTTMAFDNVEIRGGTATLAGDFDVDGNLTIVSTLNTSASNFSVNVAGNWSNASGTFTSNNSVVTLDGSSSSTMETGGTGAGKDFQTLVINKSGGAVVTLINDNLDVDGTLTINSGVLYLNGRNITTTTSFVNNGTLRLQGIETVSWTVNDTDSGTWEYVGRNIAETITVKDFGVTDYFNLIITDTNTNKATFSSGAAKVIAGAFTVSSGTYNANGQATTVTGLATVSGGTYQASTATQTFNGGLTISSGTFTGSTGAVDVNGVLTLSGGTLTAPTGSFTISGNWVNNGGTFNAGTGTVTFDGTTTISGSSITTFNNVTITGTLTGHATNINVRGNWANNGTFIHNSGTVTFIDNTQTSVISGSTTFFNFTSTIAGKQITFTAGTTQTISGTLTLTGASGNLILLRSSVSASQWSINPQGSKSVSFVDVKDSNNINASEIAAANSKDSGNNTNWNLVDHFVITGTASQTAGASNQLTITAIDGVGGTSTSFNGDKLLTFSGANSISSFTPTATDKTGSAVNFGTATTITFTNGVSSAGGLMVLYKAETASVAVTDGTSSTTSPLSVTVSRLTASKLLFVQQPSNAPFGSTISPAITVQISDQFGNAAISDNSTNVSIAIGTSPGTGILSGTTVNTASAGIATFSNLSISFPGNGYTLTVSSAGLTGAVSNTFNITGSALDPAAAAFANSQISTADVLRILLPDARQLNFYQVSTFIPTAPVYLYHPLTPSDIAFFEELFRRRGSQSADAHRPIIPQPINTPLFDIFHH